MILGGRKKWVGRTKERDSVIEAIGRDSVIEAIGFTFLIMLVLFL